MTQLCQAWLMVADCCTAASCSAWFRWRIYQDDTDVVDPENAGSRLGIELIAGRQAKEGEVIHTFSGLRSAAITANQVKQTPRQATTVGLSVCASNVEAFAATHSSLTFGLVNLNPSFRPSFRSPAAYRPEIAGSCHRPRLSAFVFKHDVFRRRFVNKFQYIAIPEHPEVLTPRRRPNPLPR